MNEQVSVFWSCRLRRGYTGAEQKGEYHLYGRYPTKAIAEAILAALKDENTENIEFDTLVKLAEAGDRLYTTYYAGEVNYRVQYSMDGTPIAIEIVGGYEYYP